MLNYFLFFLTVLSAFSGSAQDKELANLLKEEKYEEAYNRGTLLFHKNPDDIFVLHCLGRVYAHLAAYKIRPDYYDSSMQLLWKVIDIDKNVTYVSAWSHIYIGLDYYMKGTSPKAKKSFDDYLKLQSTKNSQKLLNALQIVTGLDPFFDNWKVYERENIVYHFQDTNSIKNIDKFMDKHDVVFTKNNAVFEAKLPKKIDYYVWSDEEAAQKLYKKSLGFTKPEFLLCNVRTNQTFGHELTHVLVYWGWQQQLTNQTKFINEGIAVCFDYSNRDKFEVAKAAVKQGNIKSVLELWKNPTTEDAFYPLAGAFIEFLFNKMDKNQFRLIVKNQTPETLKTILGENYDETILEFEKLVGIR